MSGALANSTIPADLRVYITSTTPLLADGMVVFAACSAQSIAVEPATNSLPTNTLTLDAMTFFVLPGSPDSDTYNVSVVHILRSDPTLELIGQ
jgi:hypothetical protein